MLLDFIGRASDRSKVFILYALGSCIPTVVVHQVYGSEVLKVSCWKDLRILGEFLAL